MESLGHLGLQAVDERFENACVEFNAATLMPTYRLMWGTAGESQALAVAEGLGFDRTVVEEARSIAAEPHFASQFGEGLLLSIIGD